MLTWQHTNKLNNAHLLVDQCYYIRLIQKPEENTNHTWRFFRAIVVNFLSLLILTTLESSLFLSLRLFFLTRTFRSAPWTTCTINSTITSSCCFSVTPNSKYIDINRYVTSASRCNTSNGSISGVILLICLLNLPYNVLFKFHNRKKFAYKYFFVSVIY